jgi:hypothetical protein
MPSKMANGLHVTPSLYGCVVWSREIEVVWRAAPPVMKGLQVRLWVPLWLRCVLCVLGIGSCWAAAPAVMEALQVR